MRQTFAILFIFLTQFTCLQIVLTKSAFAEKNESQCANFQEALEIAAKIRGLKILKPVACKVVSAEEFSAVVNKSNATEITNHQIDEKIYKMIGLIPENYDYQNCFPKNDLESVMASYVPSENAVYIPANTTSTFDLLVHEATHALQDQHFNLDKISKPAELSTDAIYSFLALVEGDAEIVQQNYLKSLDKSKKNSTDEQPNNKQDKSCEIPQALLFQLDFPYFWGARYVKTLPNLNQAFRAIPKHSTQILYPNKKFKFKIPATSENLKLLRAHYKDKVESTNEDILGEYTLRCMLRELIGSKSSVIAGYGWEGDRIVLYKFKNKNVLTWIINIRNDFDSEELFKATKKSLEVRFDFDFNTDADTIIYGNKFYSKIFLHRKKSQIQLLISE